VAAKKPDETEWELIDDEDDLYIKVEALEQPQPEQQDLIEMWKDYDDYSTWQLQDQVLNAYTVLAVGTAAMTRGRVKSFQ